MQTALVYLADPADIKGVLRGDPAVFHAGEANFMVGEILGPTSVVGVDDDAHRRVRGMMLPAFHGDSVRRQVEQLVEITAADVEHWPVGTAFPVLPRMQAITLEVILRTVIGVQDERRLAALRDALPPLVEIGSLLSLLPPPRLLRHVGPWGRRARVRARARGLLLDEITRCRRDPCLAERTDVLAMLVRSVDESGESGESMADTELCDQLVTLLPAGHETTATGLAWTFERLTRDANLLARVVTAVDAGNEAFLDAVCKESLRIRPVVGEVGRVLTEPAEVAGYRLPAGTMVLPSISLVHRSCYDDPEEFRPERFTGRTDQSIWLPFGGGVRRCLGATFASVEMRVVLTEVLRRVELATTTEPGEAARVRHVTLVPEKGAVVTARAQRSVPARR
ncbi:MAG: cytochrome P450 [Pseudonocardiaceae bacterium]